MSEKVQGYTKFDNKLLEALTRSNLSGNELKIMLFLVRKLDGFHQVEDRIPGVQIAEGTGIAKQHVSSKLKGLKLKNYIYVVEGKVGIKRAFGLWGKVTKLVTLDKLPNTLPKVTHRAEKKVTESGTSKETQKKPPKKGENCYRKMSDKEIEKLELDQWYKAIMYNQGKFTIFYIEGTISDYPYDTRMSCWYLYREAVNVRNEEAYFSKLLADYSEKREE